METRPHEGLASLPPAPQSHLGTLIPLVMLESQPPVSWFSQPGWQGSGRGTQVGDSGETTHKDRGQEALPCPSPEPQTLPLLSFQRKDESQLGNGHHLQETLQSP